MTRPTLSDEQYRRTEGVLFRYAKKCMRIEELDGELAEINKQMIELERELHYWLELGPKTTASYSPVFGSSDPDGSPVHRTFEHAEERRTHLYDRWTKLRDRRDNLLEKLNILRIETVRLDIARQRLNEVDSKAFEYRYFYEWSNQAIGRELSYDEKTIRNHIRRIVMTMADIVGDESPSLVRVIA
jgi:hypothetical protein